MPTKIGQRFASALRTDNRVTQQEAEQLVADAKTERKWTPAMQSELKTLVQKNAAKLDPQAAKVLNDFIAAAKPKADLKDPLVLKEHRTNTTWEPVGPNATLFVDGISADDVQQGYIGDCYLASGISSVAAADPNVIKNAIKDNGDGTYTVRFFEGTGSAKKAVNVTIDDDVAKSGSRMQYATSRAENELWPGLLEKAYAKWKGGFERIGNGGNASDLFEALSGKASSWGEVKDYKADALWKKIQTTTSAHKPVAAGTFADDAPNVSYSGTGVHGDHFYTVLGASEENGTKYVQLRNPWGSDEPAGNGANDGIFKLPMADFMKLYENIEFGG